MRVGSAALVCVVALLFWGSSARAADTAFDEKIRAQLERTAPAALPFWDEANAARDANKLSVAEAGYRRVTVIAPDYDHAHRRLCGVLGEEKQSDAAQLECRRAYNLDKTSPENQAALASALILSDGAPNDPRFVEASVLAANALAAKPNDEFTVGIAAEVALRRQLAPEFRRQVSTLQRIAPDSRGALAFGMMVNLMDEDASAAREKLERARRLHALNDEEAASWDATIADVESRPSPGKIAVRVGKGLAGWAGGFVLLLALGAALSSATLRATRTATRETDGSAVGGTAWIRRLYRALIALTSLYFYLSLPVVALVVLATGIGVVWAVLATGYIAPKLFVIVILLVGASLWGIVKSFAAVFRSRADSDPGIPIERSDQPKLFAALDEVAAKVGTRGVDRVFLTPGSTVAVFERGGALATARGRGERCLLLGGGLLTDFEVRPFKAVLAHEFGHFKNEDTAGGALSLAVRRSVGELVVTLARGRAATRINPAWLFVEGFYKVFVRITHGASRLQEVLADRWAVSAYGSSAFADGLRHVIEAGARFDVELDHAVRTAVEAKAPLLNLYDGTDVGASDDDVHDAATKALEREPDPYDSHPSPQARFEAARAMAVNVPASPEDGEQVWSLFEDRAAVELTLMETICGRIATNFGVHLTLAAPERPSAP